MQLDRHGTVNTTIIGLRAQALSEVTSFWFLFALIQFWHHTRMIYFKKNSKSQKQKIQSAEELHNKLWSSDFIFNSYVYSGFQVMSVLLGLVTYAVFIMNRNCFTLTDADDKLINCHQQKSQSPHPTPSRSRPILLHKWTTFLIRNQPKSSRLGLVRTRRQRRRQSGF